MTLNDVMAVILCYFTEFGKHTLTHNILYVYDVVVKKVHVRYLIS